MTTKSLKTQFIEKIEKNLNLLYLNYYKEIYTDVDTNYIEKVFVKKNKEKQDWFTEISEKSFIYENISNIREFNFKIYEQYISKKLFTLDINLIIYEFKDLKFLNIYDEKRVDSSGSLSYKYVKNNLIKNIKNFDKNKIAKKEDKDYEKYLFFCEFIIHHILNKGKNFDEDLKKLYEERGKDNFFSPDEERGRKNSEVISNHLEECNYDCNNNKESEILKEFLFEDIEIDDTILVKKNKKYEEKTILNVSSHEKGVITEKIFGEIFNAEIVGGENKKTDAIIGNKRYSIKSSFSNKWNNHLAYLSGDDENIQKINYCLEEQEPLGRQDIDWLKMIKLFTAKDEVDNLVFQKINLDDRDEVVGAEIWNFDLSKIFGLIEKKQYIFSKNNMMVHNNGELVIKFQFKKRNDVNQVMVITDNELLDSCIDDFCEFSMHKIDSKKMKLKIR